jgi:hypothetical protein
MPRSWVKDYFKHILVDSAEDWMKGKSKGATSTRSDIIRAVSEQIGTAITDRNEPVPPELEKV